MRHLALLLTLVLLGCSRLPSPAQTMRPVQSPPGAVRTAPPSAPPAVTSPAPTQAIPASDWPQPLWSQALGSPPGRVLAVSGGALVFLGSGLRRLGEDGRLLWEFTAGGQVVQDAAVSADGNRTAVLTSAGTRGSIALLSGPDVLWQEPWVGAAARSVALSADGRIVVAGFDGSAAGPPGKLVVYTEDGRWAWGQSLNRAVLWGLPTADGDRVLMGYQGLPVLRPDEPYVGMGARLFRTGAVQEWAVVDYHRPLGLSADGTVAVLQGELATESVSPHGYLLWVGADGQELGRYPLPFKANIHRFGLADDGRHAAVALLAFRSEGGRLVAQERVVFLGPNGQMLWELEPEQIVKDLALSRDGRHVAVLTTPDLGRPEARTLTFYDQQGQPAWRYVHGAGIERIDLSADGSRLVFTAHDGRVHSLDTGAR